MEKNTVDTKQNLCKCYGKSMRVYSRVKYWFGKFRRNRANKNYASHAERP